MAVKERSQIKGTDAQIKAFAGHNGVLAFATDTKSLHVLSGTAGTTTEFLPSSKVAKNLGKTSMVQLGFAKDSTVTLVQFLQKLAEHGYSESNSVLGIEYSYADSAYITDGTNTVRIVGGTLYLGRNTHNPSNDYGVSWGFFVPPEGTKLYRFRTYKDLSQAASDTPAQNIYMYEPTGLPVGFLTLYAGSNVPDGWFRCDGSTIADMATNYPKLYAVLGTNVLPNYSGRVPLGASSDINTAVESGLPNIQGSLLVTAGHEQGTHAGFPTVADGCFFSKSWDESGINVYYVASGRAKTPDDTRKVATEFNAARSNSIYGASTTVQPPAVKVAVLIKHD